MASFKDIANLPLAAKIGIAVAIFAIITAGFYYGLYMGVADQLTSANAERDKLQGQITDAQRREEQYVQLTKELAERETIDMLNKRILPEQAEIAAFIGDLNRVADLCGLEIRLIEPRPEKKQQYFVKLPVSLSLAGSYHQLARFFFQLSKLDRIASMEDISLKEPTVMTSGEIMLKANAMATTYRRAAEKAKAKPKAATKDAGAKKGGKAADAAAAAGE